MFEFSLLWTIAGFLIAVLVMVDAIVTTLLLSGAGSLSQFVSGWVGRSCMRRDNEIFSKNATIFALLSTCAVWGLLLLGGWALVFSGSADAIVASSDKTPADFFSRVYFAGFTLTTLGSGDYVPNGTIWQLLTITASANGFFFFTIIVTYTFSVLNAVNERRAIGVAIGLLGPSLSDFIQYLRDKNCREPFVQRLQELTQRLETATVKREAYPVVEFTHVPDTERSFAVGIAKLGLLCAVEKHGIITDRMMPTVVLEPLKKAIRSITRESGEEGSREVGEPLRLLEELFIKHDVAANWRRNLESPPFLGQLRQLDAWLAMHHRDWNGVILN